MENKIMSKDNLNSYDQQPKKAYNAPILVTFGDMRTLTQSGTGTCKEGAPGCKDPNKKA